MKYCFTLYVLSSRNRLPTHLSSLLVDSGLICEWQECQSGNRLKSLRLMTRNVFFINITHHFLQCAIVHIQSILHIFFWPQNLKLYVSFMSCMHETKVINLIILFGIFIICKDKRTKLNLVYTAYPWWHHQMEAFYWPFLRGIHQSLVHTPHKTSDAELWCLLWSVLEPTFEQTIETLIPIYNMARHTFTFIVAARYIKESTCCYTARLKADA